ncbi:MAG: phosphate regulon sensor histidine kinase PhoR [Burkholderiaceae bacterium]
MIWRTTIAVLAAGIGIALALLLTGWPIAAFVLVSTIAVAGGSWHTFNLVRLLRWIESLERTSTPISYDGWSSAFVQLGRLLRHEARLRGQSTAELARVRAAADRLPDALVILAPDGVVAWANQTACELFAIDRWQRPIAHYLRSPDFLAYLATGRFAAPLRLTLPSRPGRTHEIRIHVTEDEQRLMITRDISDQAKLDAVRSDFVANVSHEIRTPLTVIGGFAETMLDIPLDEDSRRGYLESILRHSKTMHRLVDDLLMLSSLERTYDRPEESDVDLESMFNSLASDARAVSAGRHTICVQVPEAVTVRAVSSELESAIRNLLSNAVRYTPQGGHVTLAWERDEDGDGRIMVTDTGIGIAPEHLPRLSERFYRVDRGRSRDTGGTGLGLAIVKHIAGRHGARLEIESEIGKGSTFSLRLPASRILATRPEQATARPV